MSVDYIVSSLPALAFESAPSLTWARFAEMAGAQADAVPDAWRDLDAQLRNALAEARTGARDGAWKRPVRGCSLYWRKRVADCFAERDVAKRQDLLDRVWWDAAGELVPPSDPLGKGALAAYAIRLKLALRRAKFSAEAGSAAFEKTVSQ